MQRVTKYCKLEHHYLNCDTIRIGTFDYYRNIENDLIRDDSEGKTFTHKFYNKDSEQYISKENASILGIHGAGITISPGATVTLMQQYVFQNCYMFSTSNSRRGKKRVARDLGYQEWYSIRDTETFMRRLSAEILPYIRFKTHQPRRFYIKCEHHPIQYKDSEDYVIQDGGWYPTKEAYFSKPKVSPKNPNKKYFKENEYRMVWTVRDYSTDDILPVEGQFIDINFTSSLKELCY